MQKKHVVVVGGGFGGLTLVRELRNQPVDITLIDRSNHFLFQPLLYQVAIGALSPGDIATPLRQILQEQTNVNLVLADVRAVDRAERSLTLATGEQVRYDMLVLAPGNQPAYFRHPEWATFAPGLKEITDALYIREKLYLAFERASQVDHPSERVGLLTFVIVGGGPTGVEVAGILAQLVTKTLRSDFRNFGPNEISIHLVEGGDRLLAGFDAKLSDAARKDLEDLGVNIVLNTFVEHIDRNTVRAGGVTYRTENVIWAAGNEGSPLLASLGTETDRGGRAVVNPDLSLPGDPDVFVIGDAANAKDERGVPLPGVAQVAMQQGQYLAQIVKHDAAPRQRKPFRYRDRGSMATIGRNRAVAEIGKLKLTGFLAWLMWSFIHVFYLINFRNRVRVFMEWIWFYVTFRPGARLIYRNRIDAGRDHLASLRAPLGKAMHEEGSVESVAPEHATRLEREQQSEAPAQAPQAEQPNHVR